MTRTSLALTLIVPIAIAACAKQEPPPPAPILNPGEQACIAQGAAAAGVDPATVTATAVSSTKLGDTIYSVVAGGVGYNCVASPDGTVTSFQPQ
ncbi:hypothetical protein [uncultured Amaricoccus sp.]|uniref:hypothetical protein n=1 Tax=uncultured Amaricoccus sp. TaxID=339341 RepID=UPI002603460D|nr:hypothetical protein [uncultured Amaricoccus sp.]